MTTLDYLNISLRINIVANLKPGEKIWIDIDSKTDQKKFSIDKSYFPAIVRTIYDQNHIDIINTIVDDCTYIKNNIDKFTDNEKKILKSKMNNLTIGLENMKITYKNKIECVKKLNELILFIKKYLKYDSEDTDNNKKEILLKSNINIKSKNIKKWFNSFLS